MENGSAILMIQKIRMSVRFQNVLFPLDVVGFAQELVNMGFQLTAEIPPIETKSISRLSFTGPLARKESTLIDINSEKQFIGVSDNDVSKVIKTFTDVMNLIGDNHLGGTLKPWFYELQGRLVCCFPDTEKKMISKITSLKHQKELKKQLGFDVMQRGIKIASSISADSSNYFEMTLEPILGKEKSSYDALVIYRNEEKEIIDKFIQSVENNLLSILMAI